MVHLQRLEEFIKYNPEDCCKAAWNFYVDDGDGKSVILTTETRVYCPNKAVRRRFAAYWLLIRPFSVLIRIITLSMIKKKAEQVAKEGLTETAEEHRETDM